MNPPENQEPTRILLVDDEPFVLEGLRRQLAREYEIATATGGADALAALTAGPPFAVILSDLRMPGMNGVELLTAAREASPDTVRMLLTGNADLDAALGAVNQGEVFRFLTKPCPPQVLFPAIASAARQYQLITSERVLLEQTLHGSIHALIDALSLANPVAFGRASRIKGRVRELADAAGLTDLWRIEVAAMLSQIGLIALSPETVDKLATGEPLSQAERDTLDRMPEIIEQLLGQVPRLESMRAMIAFAGRPWEGHSRLEDDPVFLGGSVLRVALEFDTLEGRGIPALEALARLRGIKGSYNPTVLDALGRLLEADGPQARIREMPLHQVASGMTFVDDVRSPTGLLLIPKGFKANIVLIERIRNFSEDIVDGDVQVLLDPVRHPAEDAAVANTATVAGNAPVAALAG
jgi:response regulator RpfG family c-di-GMP phosphodiesterase